MWYTVMPQNVIVLKMQYNTGNINTHSNTVFINECDKRTNTKEQNKKQTEQI